MDLSLTNDLKRKKTRGRITHIDSLDSWDYIVPVIFEWIGERRQGWEPPTFIDRREKGLHEEVVFLRPLFLYS